MELIKRLVKGQTPTLLEADKGNEIIDAINALSRLRFRRGSKDAIYYSDNEIILQLKEDTGGSDINATEFNMLVCVNGEAKLKTFYVK